MTQRICIVQPAESIYSETFIGDQVRYLSERFDCRSLSGGYFPERFDTGRAIMPEDLLHRAWRSMVRRVTGVTWDVARRKALTMFLRKNAFDLVLAEYGPTGAEIAGSCRAAGVPLAIHFHGFDAYRESTIQTYAALYREMFEYAAVLVAVSRDMRDQLIHLGAAPEKVAYNPCGIDTETFAGATPATAPPTFVAVGRFVEKKAPHLTVLAFRDVAEQIPDARLVMVGDGPLLNACRQVVESEGLGERVEFPGVGDREQIAGLMKHARAFAQHSVRSPDGDCEGTPVAVLEAG
ncbi:MAG: glycosyltransferase, partial [Lentisphaerae bacterium]|nr:glycosyltransferase [Lentisphaerota bacterium]